MTPSGWEAVTGTGGLMPGTGAMDRVGCCPKPNYEDGNVKKISSARKERIRNKRPFKEIVIHTRTPSSTSISNFGLTRHGQQGLVVHNITWKSCWKKMAFPVPLHQIKSKAEFPQRKHAVTILIR
jgi:hypothetical protein